MRREIAIIAALLLAAACATSTNEALEKAQFALDSEDWNTAIAETTSIIADDPGNARAALLLSSAYAGRAGIRILAVASDITSDANADQEFAGAHAALVQNVQDLADLRNAITTLTSVTPAPAVGEEVYGDHQFQLGILETIEAFGLPTITAKPEETSTLNVALITDKANAQNDFLEADGHLVNAGADADNQLLQIVRKNYCVLKNASPGASGFTLTALQDLTLCELTPAGAGRDALTAANGSFRSANITTCADFNFNVCDGAGETNL